MINNSVTNKNALERKYWSLIFEEAIKIREKNKDISVEDAHKMARNNIDALVLENRKKLTKQLSLMEI